MGSLSRAILFAALFHFLLFLFESFLCFRFVFLFLLLKAKKKYQCFVFEIESVIKFFFVILFSQFCFKLLHYLIIWFLLIYLLVVCLFVYPFWFYFTDSDIGYFGKFGLF